MIFVKTVILLFLAAGMFVYANAYNKKVANDIAAVFKYKPVMMESLINVAHRNDAYIGISATYSTIGFIFIGIVAMYYNGILIHNATVILHRIECGISIIALARYVIRYLRSYYVMYTRSFNKESIRDWKKEQPIQLSFATFSLFAMITIFINSLMGGY